MAHFVYRIVNTLNDKTYVGIASDPDKQISNHFTGSGSRLILEDAREHGRGVFLCQVVDSAETEKEATQKMQILILRQNALYPNGYNLSLHGKGSKGTVWSAEQRAKVTGSRNARSKLTEADVAAIYFDPRSRDVISKQYGVSKTMVTKIRRGQAWQHITRWLVPVEEPSDHP